MRKNHQQTTYRLFSMLLASSVVAMSVSSFAAEPGVKPELAFANMKWTGFEPEGDDGKVRSIRPIVLTHAGDGTNRIFVATERGVVHVFDNDQNAKQTKVFLDISKKVSYNDRQNEEGLLGMAFHPNYKENGELFIYYTSADTPQLSVISRFRVSKDDPNKADAEFEQEIMQIQQPYWNHNGGTLAFGPDGFLYIALGDGGAGGDPHGNGQNVKTLPGSILRIDVNKNSEWTNYTIPKDNPFAKGKNGARPEIYAYGIRNIWRMSFDRKTGDLWAADVGQKLWEEINIIENGGNYGWSVREGAKNYQPDEKDAASIQKARAARPELNAKPSDKAPSKPIDPIFAYDHSLGRSITGGHVYRGKALPQLVGSYLYSDYVTGRFWALKYDAKKGKVVSNDLIAHDATLQALSFGEDEKGEVYFLVTRPSSKVIYRFVNE